MSVDRGHVQFNAASELGTIDQNLFVTGTGVIINQDQLAPVSLVSNTTYTGIYATDTFEVTPRLAPTAGGRFNIPQISLDAQFAGALASANPLQQLNPRDGATRRHR